MKYKKLNYLVFLVYLISCGGSYSIERPDIKNLIIHNEKKKIEKIEFFNSKKKKITLNDYKSNILIVNFWATWCAPCKEEMPHLNQLKSRHKFKNIEIIPINIEDQKLEKLNSFYKDLNLNKLEIFYGPSLKMSKIFKLRGIPTTLFIDKEGYEFARVIGFVDFENESFLDWLANYL